MSNFLVNPFISFPASGALGLYQELGRTSGSGTDSITVSSFSAKPYLMILCHLIPTGGTISGGDLRFNSDSGSNYARRYSTNGDSDVTAVNEAVLSGIGTTSQDQWICWFISNTTSDEKLVQSFGSGGIYQSGSGASNAPNRREVAGKWTNTSDQITTVEVRNNGSGNFDSGSEVVVLGCDPADTSGASVWEELASVELSVAADEIDTGSFTAKRYLFTEWVTPKVDGVTNPKLRFNDDSGSNYASRHSFNGSENTETSFPYGRLDESGNNTGMVYGYMFSANKSDREKLTMVQSTNQNTAGAGTASDRTNASVKWSNTSSQINDIKIVEVGGDAGKFAIGSTVKVWGFD